MPDTPHLDQDQRRLIADLASAWRAYVPLARKADEFVGGMGFKTVSGAAYLVRYFPDPVTGRKKFRSMGRQTPLAEQKLHRWVQDRESYKEAIAEASARLDLTGRLAKAHRLARVPAKTGDFLRKLDLLGVLDDGLAVCGPVALYAYEMDAGQLAPHFFYRSTGRPDVELTSLLRFDHLKEILKASLGEGSRLRPTDSALEGHIDGFCVVIHDASELFSEFSSMTAMSASRDSKPVPVTAVSRRDWITIEKWIASDDPLFEDRCEFVIATMSDDEQSHLEDGRITF
ncbi:MAG TPA: hypothetical protein ENH55_06880 [Aurantimonas coralicida]|uniref:Uncharacterized protein n=2 Tax=root TaxID=1 RepID=A0A9C9NDD0_9HYPH|nr:hypothetical protein [Aurantimonas coralicida]HET99756.1 hypothetical protein [Aurantimonas coralicida]